MEAFDDYVVNWRSLLENPCYRNGVSHLNSAIKSFFITQSREELTIACLDEVSITNTPRYGRSVKIFRHSNHGCRNRLVREKLLRDVVYLNQKSYEANGEE